MTIAPSTDIGERNAAVLRCVIEEGFGKGNLAALDDVVAPHIVEHQPGLPPTRDGLKAVISELRRIYPDLTFTVEDMTVDGDKVWGRFTARGTWRGDMMGHKATGQRMEITVMDVIRVEDGKLVEHWGVPDRFHQLEQLGLLPVSEAH